jgi:hypothetical protein
LTRLDEAIESAVHIGDANFADRIRLHLHEAITADKHVLVVTGPNFHGAFRVSYRGDPPFMMEVAIMLIQQLQLQSPPLAKELLSKLGVGKGPLILKG